MNKLYSDKVLDHFYHPRNMGSLSEGDPQVGVGKVGNPVCGDVMKLFIEVGGSGIIEDVKFQTLGCGAAIATSSIATEMIRGKPLSEAVKLSEEAIEEALDGLPPVKRHCSVLAVDAVKKAAEDYRGKRNP